MARPTNRMFRRWMSRFIVGAIPVLLVFALLAVPNQADSVDESFQVHIMFPGSVRFFDVQREAMQAKADELSLELTFWDAEWSASTQLTQVRRAIDSDADLVAIAAAGTEVTSEASVLLAEASIPLVTFTNSVTLQAPWTGPDVIAHVGRDEEQAGRLLGGQVLDAAQGPTVVLSIEGPLGLPPQLLRYSGMEEVLEADSDVSIGGRANIDGWQLDVLEAELPSLLERIAPDVIAVQWADAAVLVSRHLTRLGDPDTKVVTLEWTANLVAEMENGVVLSSTYASVAEEGATTIEVAARILAGAEVTRFVEINQQLVTAENSSTVVSEW